MKKEILSRVRKVEVYHLEKEELPIVVPENTTGFSDSRSLEENDRRGRYFESDICEGLCFLKYRHDVEYEGGSGGLSSLEFNILLILNDEGGKIAVDDVMSQCWSKPPSYDSFRVALSKLNKKLDNIGVPKVATTEDERLQFL